MNWLKIKYLSTEKTSKNPRNSAYICFKFESIEFSSGINFCDDVGAAVATMIDNINADIKQVTDNIPIVFTIAQLIANQ